MKRIFHILLLAISATVIPSPSGASPAEHLVTAPNDALPQIHISGRTLKIKADESCRITFEIYSITGQLVKKFQLENGSYTIELPKGYFIVKCPKWSKKIIIKG